MAAPPIIRMNMPRNMNRAVESIELSSTGLSGISGCVIIGSTVVSGRFSPLSSSASSCCVVWFVSGADSLTSISSEYVSSGVLYLSWVVVFRVLFFWEAF